VVNAKLAGWGLVRKDTVQRLAEEKVWGGTCEKSMGSLDTPALISWKFKEGGEPRIRRYWAKKRQAYGKAKWGVGW